MYNFIEDLGLVEHKKKLATRTWRERLFSLPWRPLKDWKWIYWTEPMQDVYKIGGFTYIGHPTTIRKLRLELARRGFA